MRVQALAPAIFQYPGIRLERELRGLFAKRLDRVKEGRIARPGQPAIKEHRRRGHDDAAVDIVLALTDRCVADPYRSVPSVSGERRRSSLLEDIRMHHAIEWPDLIGAATGDAQNIGDEIFHRARCTDA